MSDNFMRNVMIAIALIFLLSSAATVTGLVMLAQHSKEIAHAVGETVRSAADGFNGK